MVGPFVPEDSGIEGGTQYKLNQITSTDKVYNQELSGPGTDRFMQVELNKILINKDTKEFISNLSDVTFELWITDESGNRIELVDTMVTGKDMANAGEDPEEAKEVAGFAMSVSFSLTDRLRDGSTDADGNKIPASAYEDAIKALGDGEYKVHLTLVETKWPLDASPVQTEYSWWAETDGEIYTVDDNWTGDNSIRNTQEVLVPVRVRKMGYDAGDTDKSEAKPLEGVKFGVWTNAQCTGEPVAEAITGADGYAEFRLKPNTEYWLKEMTTAEGYQKDGTPRKFTTPNYGATYEISEPVYNVSYPEVKLKKTNAAGTGLEGVKFKITKTDGSQITDPDGKIISNASDGYYVTTGSNGETDVFSLPEGSYKVEEVKFRAYRMIKRPRSW